MNASLRPLPFVMMWLAIASAFQFSLPELFGQGTVDFRNTATTTMTTNSTAISPPGQPPNTAGNTGLGYTVGLYIAPQGTTDSSLFQLVGTTPSQSGIAAGRFNGNPVGGFFAISNNTGQPIAFQVRAWSTAAGPTYEAAGSSGFNVGYIGQSAIGQVTPSTNGIGSALFGTGAGQVGGFVLVPVGLFAPPNVSIVEPTNTLFSTAATFNVRVFHNDPDGYMRYVYLFTNDVTASLLSYNCYFCSPSYSTFTLSNLTAGSYTLRARAVDNDGLYTTSAPLTIHVAERPVLEFARGSNGTIQFQFNSATGINYVVESGILTNFSPVVTNAGTANRITYSETNDSATQRTYRVRLE